MLYLGVLKRVLPFFLTFAAGLFIASFVVNIAAPSFNFQRRSYRYHEMQRLRIENQDLKRTNSELRRQLEEARGLSELNLNLNSDSMRFDPPPPPPPPSVKVIHPRFER